MKAFGYFVLALLVLLALAAFAAWAMGWGLGDWSDTRGPQLAWNGSIAALIAAGILASARQKASTTIFSLLAWAGAFLILILAYSFRDDARALWARVRGEFFGSEAVITASGDVELRRMPDGHFYADADANGGSLTLMVDTGASGIALSWTDARTAGIDPATLNFGAQSMTAAGPASVAPVRLARIQIGPIVRLDVEAVVLPDGSDQSLLGMSFLNTLSAFEISGDTLTLRD